MPAEGLFEMRADLSRYLSGPCPVQDQFGDTGEREAGLLRDLAQNPLPLVRGDVAQRDHDPEGLVHRCVGGAVVLELLDFSLQLKEWVRRVIVAPGLPGHPFIIVQPMNTGQC